MHLIAFFALGCGIEPSCSSSYVRAVDSIRAPRNPCLSRHFPTTRALSGFFLYHH
ncbi:hypothetical protein PanWU01x14_180990, partial [Parasponia andersonii]